MLAAIPSKETSSRDWWVDYRDMHCIVKRPDGVIIKCGMGWGNAECGIRNAELETGEGTKGFSRGGAGKSNILSFKERAG